MLKHLFSFNQSIKKLKLSKTPIIECTKILQTYENPAFKQPVIYTIKKRYV